MASNSSFHSTQDEFESVPQVGREAGSGGVFREEEQSEGGKGGSKEEIRLLRQALESVQTKLLETRKENRSLQAQLKPERREREEYESVREKGREEELMETLAELQAKLTDTQERYHQAVEEVEELRAQVGMGDGETMEKQEIQRRSEQEKAAQRIRQLEEALGRMEEERQSGAEKAQIEELYKEAQEEIRMLQVVMGFFFFSLNFCIKFLKLDIFHFQLFYSFF